MEALHGVAQSMPLIDRCFRIAVVTLGAHNVMAPYQDARTLGTAGLASAPLSISDSGDIEADGRCGRASLMWIAMHLRLAIVAVLAAGIGCGSGCNAPADAADPLGWRDAPWPTKAWFVSPPEEQGMHSASLARLVEKIGTYKQDSFLLVRHGKIVAEAYYAPYVAGINHDLRSVTKSVVGTLTAIQLQKGFLNAVDQPVMELFAEKRIMNVDDRKKAMTVQTLLDMTSGIEWVEKALTPDEPLMRMYESPDHAAFVLNRPMAEMPGTTFNYNGGNPYLLSALINEKVGQNALDFAKQELFEPLGIKGATWGPVDAQGITDGETGLFLSPHDMARIGYLYLRNGMWAGAQIIPSSWVDRVKEGSSATFEFHYANLWWSIPEKGAYMARGRHSQLILVIPRLDVVAVMTGVLRDDELYYIPGLVDDIADAVKSDQALRADRISQALLTNAINQAAIERPSAIGGVPELAEVISGKRYRFADNILHVKSFTLNFTAPDSSWVITTYTGRVAHPTARFAGLVGLDGVYRRSPPARYGIGAAKGRWISDRAFAMERRILGHGEIQTWTLTFDGNKVTVNFDDTDGVKAELHGEASD